MTGEGKHCTESEEAGMKEYIERAAAMDAILGLTIADPAVAQYADAVCYHLQNLPAADVAEVRHGRWEMAPCNGVYDMRCSACGFCPGIRFFSSNYCPDCGARMDKEDEHEAD